MNYKIVVALLGSVAASVAMESATKKQHRAPVKVIDTIEQLKEALQQGDSLKGLNMDEDLIRQALRWATEEGEAMALHSLLAHGCDANMALTEGGLPGEAQTRPLHVAIENNHRTCCEVLLNHGACSKVANLASRTPIGLAIQNGASLEICQLLIDKGALSGEGLKGPHWAAIFWLLINRACPDLCRLFLTYGGDLRVSGPHPALKQPLVLATRRVNADVIESLIGNACYVPRIRNNADHVRWVRTFLGCMKRMGYSRDLSYQILTALPELRKQVATILIPVLLAGQSHLIEDVRLQHACIEEIIKTTCITLVPLMEAAREEADESDKHLFDENRLTGDYGQLITENVERLYKENMLLTGRVPEVEES